MSGVITSAEQVTIEWLSQVLEREGVQDGCVVSHIDRSNWPGLVVNYNAANESSVAPARLYLKVVQEDPLNSSPDILIKRRAISDGGANEVAFYALIADRRAELPMIVRCYDAVHNPARRVSHLLLHDYSQTHLEVDWPVPSQPHREQIIDCTADFHAYWWERPELSEIKKIDLNIKLNCQDEASYQAYVTQQVEAFPYFVEFMGDRLDTTMRQHFEKALAALPGLWQSYLAPRLSSQRMTLLHGDSHWGQFVCPKQPQSQMTYMGDMACFHTGLPAADLAYRLCFSWPVEKRREMEDALIRRYLTRLEARGVTNYDYDAFMQDYRLSLIFLTFYFQYFFTARFENRTDPARKEKNCPSGGGTSTSVPRTIL